MMIEMYPGSSGRHTLITRATDTIILHHDTPSPQPSILMIIITNTGDYQSFTSISCLQVKCLMSATNLSLKAVRPFKESAGNDMKHWENILQAHHLPLGLQTKEGGRFLSLYLKLTITQLPC